MAAPAQDRQTAAAAHAAVWPSTPVDRGARISEMIARRILRDIASGDIQAGGRLPAVAAMMAEYRVGRSSLREALRMLETQGVIVVRPGASGGPVVAEVTSRHFGRMSSVFYQIRGATFRQIMEARLVIEPALARFAAGRGSPEVHRRLQDSTDRAAAASAHDEREYNQLSTEFHDIVAGFSGNEVLDLVAGSLKDIYASRVRTAIFPPEMRATSLKEHRLITAAILAGQEARAERLMRLHMEEFMDHVAAMYPGMMDEVVQW